MLSYHQAFPKKPSKLVKLSRYQWSKIYQCEYRMATAAEQIEICGTNMSVFCIKWKSLTKGFQGTTRSRSTCNYCMFLFQLLIFFCICRSCMQWSVCNINEDLYFQKEKWYPNRCQPKVHYSKVLGTYRTEISVLVSAQSLFPENFIRSPMLSMSYIKSEVNIAHACILKFYNFCSKNFRKCVIC